MRVTLPKCILPPTTYGISNVLSTYFSPDDRGALISPDPSRISTHRSSPFPPSSSAGVLALPPSSSSALFPPRDEDFSPRPGLSPTPPPHLPSSQHLPPPLPPTSSHSFSSSSSSPPPSFLSPQKITGHVINALGNGGGAESGAGASGNAVDAALVPFIPSGASFPSSASSAASIGVQDYGKYIRR